MRSLAIITFSLKIAKYKARPRKQTCIAKAESSACYWKFDAIKVYYRLHMSADTHQICCSTVSMFYCSTVFVAYQVHRLILVHDDSLCKYCSTENGCTCGERYHPALALREVFFRLFWAILFIELTSMWLHAFETVDRGQSLLQLQCTQQPQFDWSIFDQ